jgi:hypothetical protein
MMSNAVTGTSRPFLTSSPRTLKICANKNYYLYALINIGNEPVRLRVAVYDSSGTQITAASKSLTTTSDYIVRYAVGPENIELWSAGLLNGASYYTVQLQNGASAGISEIFTFQVDCECSKYTENFRLHFLNHLGGFDAKSFNFKFERKFKLNKSFYTKILGSQDDSTGVFTYAVSDAGEVNFDTITTETITINTNNITEEESKWLLTLLKSTQVYWEIDVDVYAPVVVTDVSYEQQLYASKKLFNVSVTIRISNEIISQRQ